MPFRFVHTTDGRGKPSVKQVAEVLWLVAKFLAEVADVGRFHEVLPRYLRKPLHQDLMDMMGLGPTPAAPAAAGAAASAGGAGPNTADAGDGIPVQIDRASFRSKLFLVPPEPHGGSSSSSDEDGSGEDSDGDDASSTTSVKPDGDGAEEEDEEEQRQRWEQEEAAALQRANAALIAHDTSHYYLKRWVWMQFPWLVMANTALALRLFLSRPEDEPTVASAPSTSSSSSMPPAPPATAATAAAAAAAAAAEGGKQHRFPRGRAGSDGAFRRMWTVKKVDPSRVVSSSPADAHVLRTMVHSSVLRIAPHAGTAERLAQSICAEDRLLSRKRGEEETADAAMHVREEEAKEAAAAADEAAHTLLVAPGLPMTLQEKRLAESNKRVARLRSIFDRVVEDRALMAAQLARLERAAAARDQHDRAILAGIHEGELMVEALALRLRRLQDANTEAAALMVYYKLVIAQCLEKNPVKDTKRVESVERQVALASFQLRSLIYQRDRVAGERVAIEEEGIPKAQAQLEQVRQERARVRERLTFFRRQALPGSSSRLAAPSSHSQALVSMLATTTLFLKGVLPPHSPDRVSSSSSWARVAAAAQRASPTPSSPSKGERAPGSDGGNGKGSSSTSSTSSSSMPEAPAPPKLTPYQSVFAASRAQRLCTGMERLFELSGVDAQRAPEDDGPKPPAPEEAAGKIVHKFKNVRKLNNSFLAECRDLEARITDLRGALQAQERKAAASSIDRRPVLDGGDATDVEQQLPHREQGELEALIHEEGQRCARFAAMSTTANEMLDRVKVRNMQHPPKGRLGITDQTTHTIHRRRPASTTWRGWWPAIPRRCPWRRCGPRTGSTRTSTRTRTCTRPSAPSTSASPPSRRLSCWRPTRWRTARSRSLPPQHERQLAVVVEAAGRASPRSTTASTPSSSRCWTSPPPRRQLPPLGGGG